MEKLEHPKNAKEDEKLEYIRTGLVYTQLENSSGVSPWGKLSRAA